MLLLRKIPSISKFSRHMSNVKKTDISKTLKLREVPSDVKGKPLVLLFDWLYAKPSAVKKYCYLYHERGLDVLCVRGQLSQFLWPQKSYTMCEELLKYLLETHPSQKYFIHAFSIGAYNYDVCMFLANENKEKYGEFTNRVMGQIFDSITIGSYEQMSRGVASILPSNVLLKDGLMKILNAYFKLTSEKTTKQYDILVDFFKEQPVKVPTLLFYARNDPMCDVASMEEMIAKWKKMENFDVSSQYWEESVHCAHLKYHRKDYLKNWEVLMTKLGL